MALVVVLLAAGLGAFWAASAAAPRTTSGAVAVQPQPYALAYVPTNHDLYVSSLATSDVQVYSPAGVLLTTIPVGTGPAAMTYDTATAQLFVADETVDAVTVISTATNTVVATIGVGSAPQSIAYDNLTNAIYVGNFFSDNVSVIPSGGTVVSQSIALSPGDEPQGLAFDPVNGEIYVADAGSGHVSVIDGTLNSVVATIPIGGTPFGIAYDAANGFVYASDIVQHTVNFHAQYNISVIDGAANVVVQTIATGETPGFLYYDPASTDLLASEYLSGQVLMISSTTNGGVAYVSVGNTPEGMAYDPANSYVYVANYGSGTLSYFGARSFNPAAEITPGGTPNGMAYDPLNHETYLADSNGILTIDPATNVVRNTTIGTAVNNLLYDPATREIYATTGTYGSTVLAINATSNALVGSVQLAPTAGPEQLALDTANGNIYVANFWDKNITGFNPVTLQTVANISLYVQLTSIAYDPANGYLFVGSVYSDNISIINPSTGALVTNWTDPYAASPTAMAYSPATHDMYIADPYVVLVVSSLTLTTITSVLFGAEPQGLGYDPVDRAMVVGGRNAIYWLTPSSGILSEVYGTPDQNTYTAYFVGTVNPSNNCVYLTTTTDKLVDLVRT